MKKVNNFIKALIKDESGQGATEYILLLVAVVAVAIIFKGKITEFVTSKMDSIAGEISGFSSGGN